MRSLSPKRISSLGDGVVLVDDRHARRARAGGSACRRACRYWRRSTKSWGTSSTCAGDEAVGASARRSTRISRLWPAAESACSVRDVGRPAPRRPSAATPAATAPERDQRRPRGRRARSAATSAHSSRWPRRRSPPRSSVSDDVPILATTPHRHVTSGSVLEAEARRSRRCRPSRGAGPGQRLVDAEPLEPVVDVGQRLGRW